MRYTRLTWQFSDQQCTTNVSGTELRNARILHKKLKVCGYCQLYYISTIRTNRTHHLLSIYLTN